MSPAPKRRCVQPTEGEEDEEEEDTLLSDTQLSLFKGLSFLLTMRRKDDRHLGIVMILCQQSVHHSYA